MCANDVAIKDGIFIKEGLLLVVVLTSGYFMFLFSQLFFSCVLDKNKKETSTTELDDVDPEVCPKLSTFVMF